MVDTYIYVDETGVITVDTQEILTQVQDEYKAIFGDDLNISASTPQGMLITAQTLSRTNVARNNATLANQINPNLAGGTYLDAIAALTGIARTPATPSSVYCTLTGVAGTVIPEGSIASETASGSQYQFQTVADVTIPSGGTANNVLFQSVDNGAIPAPSGTLTNIVSNVLGWETVTNDSAATLGTSTQSDASFRNYRRNTLAAQGTSSAEAIMSEVTQVSGVGSLTYRENFENTTQVIDGITLVAHSIYVCVDGGTNADVAEALTNSKSMGANYNNGASADPQSVDVTDPYSGQTVTVLFDRPDVVEISVQATVTAGSSVQDPTTAVKDAILAYQAGSIDGEDGLNVGTNVSAFELAGAVNIQSPGIYVTDMEIKKTDGGSFSNDTIDIELWEKANIEDTSITVLVP